MIHKQMTYELVLFSESKTYSVNSVVWFRNIWLLMTNSIDSSKDEFQSVL